MLNRTPANQLRHRNTDDTITVGVECPKCCKTNSVPVAKLKKSEQPGALQQHNTCDKCGFVFTMIFEFRYWIEGRVNFTGVDWLKRD